jgi:hypothetical protein
VIAIHTLADREQVGDPLFTYRVAASWDEVWTLAQRTREAEGLRRVRVDWVRYRDGALACFDHFPATAGSAQPPEPVLG